MTSKTDYSLAGNDPARRFPAPRLAYQPPRPESYRPQIGLIGCGGITEYHLRAYRKARYAVVAMADVDITSAERRRDEFYPKAVVHTDYRELLARPDIDVVDVATHPEPREAILADAIRAGKHILSQKPFVVDLNVGRRLARTAKRKGVHLAVNQNGRWAPHFAYMRQAVASGLIGDVISVDLSVHWDHNWVSGTPFNDIPQLLFYDFGIHWFDILNCFMQHAKARHVSATLFRSPSQQARPPLLGQVRVEYPRATGSIVLNGDTRFGPRDRTLIVGTKGTLVSDGPNLNEQTVTLHTARGTTSPKLNGTWFTNGFEGTLGELLCAVEQNREPYNSAKSNLSSLAIAFAAIAATECDGPVAVGSIDRLQPNWFKSK
jgi:predicted dehydrogenase